MLRCYDSKRQNQEGWSSLHEHFGGKRRRFTTLNHKQKNLQSCCAHDCAQKIFNLYKTAEGRLAVQGWLESRGARLLQSKFGCCLPGWHAVGKLNGERAAHQPETTRRAGAAS